jgi:hypothetical protein
MPQLFQYITNELSVGHSDVQQYILFVFLGNLRPLMSASLQEELSQHTDSELRKLKEILKKCVR